MTGFRRHASYVWDSVQTYSYWRYAAFSPSALSRMLTFVGGLYLFLEMLDFFGIYTRDRYAAYAIFVVIAVSFVAAIITRTPTTRVIFKLPKKDLSIEVRIDDLLSMPGQVVISSNTTFDTDTANGIIALDSVQGQFASKYFPGRLGELDELIDRSLKDVTFETISDKPGKAKRYPVGTVARVDTHGQTFLFAAMAHMDEHATARSNVDILDGALSALWRYVAERGELADIVMPVMGSGRARLTIPRKKIIERIAQSFVDASRERIFSNKLVIVVRPADAARFEINLFEIRDHLSQNLHT